MRRFSLVLTCLGALLLGGCGVDLGSHFAAPAPAPSIHLRQASAVAAHSSTASVVQKVLPSVVNIRVTQFGVTGLLGGSQTAKAEASGVIISRDGTILTNNHVIEGAVKVTVIFNDGIHTQPMEGQVVGADPDHDLAVVKVDATDLTPITIGRSGSLELGDDVIALGFPLGLAGGPTVTKGIVSGINRTVTVGGNGGITEHLVGLLQTDAAINPGNSGGALVNSAGQLVGINTAAAQAGSAENVGFAISIDDALPVVKQILTQPAERRAWLGVSVRDLDPMVALQLGLDPHATGALVAGVIPGSPAASAGIKAGDVIVAVGGHAITSATGLTTQLTHLRPGQTITVKLTGSHGSRSIQVTLQNRPATFQPKG
ncbi:MAG: trypsin-like peptidase domain-containing protein [Actinomycetota bacterium]|nr:trypsin-like peptidase domain-containing protein [Actinomycetota bacterium]